MDLITTPDAAEQLGIAPQTLRSYIAQWPELKPEANVGGNYVWTVSEIERVKLHREGNALVRHRPTN